MFNELWIHRKYILNNAITELKFRYAGSTMGIVWNFLNPLFQILVYTFIFTNVMIAKIPGLNNTMGFAIYLCAGLLAWTAFSESINRGGGAYIENANLLKKLPIPEHVFVAKVVVSAAFNGVLSYLILFIFILFSGEPLSIKWLLVPIILLLLFIFAFGISLIISFFNVLFKDTSQIVSILLNIWMWLTPIVYTRAIIPEAFQNVFNFNPIYPFIEALHQTIVYKEYPASWIWISMCLISASAFMLGYYTLCKLRKEVRDLL
ncbi:ABC transporter permease [Paenibacillus chitinolyticus]